MRPVMDILAQVSHEFLATVAAEPGGCYAIPPAEMQALQEAAAAQSELKRWAFLGGALAVLGAVAVRIAGHSMRAMNRRIPGGSAANVMKGLANISHGALDCRFVGMIGKDATGAEYRYAGYSL